MKRGPSNMILSMGRMPRTARRRCPNRKEPESWSSFTMTMTIHLLHQVPSRVSLDMQQCLTLKWMGLYRNGQGRHAVPTTTSWPSPHAVSRLAIPTSPVCRSRQQARCSRYCDGRSTDYHPLSTFLLDTRRVVRGMRQTNHRSELDATVDMSD